MFINSQTIIQKDLEGMEVRFAKVIIGDSRKMLEVGDSSVDLVVTSPPYWHIKDYGTENQIGYNQSLHQYLEGIFFVWKECFRVLKPGTRLCINIGDQFLRSAVYGRYRIAPLHSEFIGQCEKLGFDYMGSIIWQKKTTMRTTGGATVMGSYPYPDNGLIEIDYEFILVFKKPGQKKVSKQAKELSKLSKEEWKEYFSGHWSFAGERQINHEAMFPEELPKRLIKMFTFVSDTILDPFLGSGTTVKAAIGLGRNAIGYEINEKYLDMVKEKIGARVTHLDFDVKFDFQRRTKDIVLDKVDYVPMIQDARPLIEPKSLKLTKEKLYRVVKVLNKDSLQLDNGLTIKLLGIEVDPVKEKNAIEYLDRYVRAKRVFLKFDKPQKIDNGIAYAYVYLRNKIFVNKTMLKLGYARPASYQFSLKKKFEEIAGSVTI